VKDEDDFCEACGSEGCKNEDCRRCTRCRQIGCGCPPESPGAILARQAEERRAEQAKAFTDAVTRRLLPSPPKETTLEAFEARMAKRPKVEVKTRKDGTTYRTRTSR
jgi:hypothetical protein